MTVLSREEDRRVESREERMDNDLDCDEDRVHVSVAVGILRSSPSCDEFPCEGNMEGVV